MQSYQALRRCGDLVKVCRNWNTVESRAVSIATLQEGYRAIASAVAHPAGEGEMTFTHLELRPEQRVRVLGFQRRLNRLLGDLSGETGFSSQSNEKKTLEEIEVLFTNIEKVFLSTYRCDDLKSSLIAPIFS